MPGERISNNVQSVTMWSDFFSLEPTGKLYVVIPYLLLAAGAIRGTFESPGRLGKCVWVMIFLVLGLGNMYTATNQQVKAGEADFVHTVEVNKILRGNEAYLVRLEKIQILMRSFWTATEVQKQQIVTVVSRLAQPTSSDSREPAQQSASTRVQLKAEVIDVAQRLSAAAKDMDYCTLKYDDMGKRHRSTASEIDEMNRAANQCREDLFNRYESLGKECDSVADRVYRAVGRLPPAAGACLPRGNGLTGIAIMERVGQLTDAAEQLHSPK